MTLSAEPRPGRRVAFKAGRQGDDVAAVARRYRLAVADVARWNSVGAKAHFKPGQEIVVVLPHAPPSRGKAAAGRDRKNNQAVKSGSNSSAKSSAPTVKRKTAPKVRTR